MAVGERPIKKKCAEVTTGDVVLVFCPLWHKYSISQRLPRARGHGELGGEGCSGRRAALVGSDSDVAVGRLLVRLPGLVEALGTVLPPSLEQVVACQGEQEDDEDYDGYDVADVAGAHFGVVAVAQLSALRAAVSRGMVASAAQVLVADGLAAEEAAPVALAPVAVIQGTMFAVRQHQFAQSALGRRQRRRGP